MSFSCTWACWWVGQTRMDLGRWNGAYTHENAFKSGQAWTRVIITKISSIVTFEFKRDNHESCFVFVQQLERMIVY